MFVSQKRKEKVNVQRPCIAISLGQQIRQGKVKAMEPTAMPTDAEHVVNPMRNANSMAKLSHMVGFYDDLAYRQQIEWQRQDNESKQSEVESKQPETDA